VPVSHTLTPRAAVQVNWGEINLAWGKVACAIVAAASFLRVQLVG
jgi:hypothetical protein